MKPKPRRLHSTTGAGALSGTLWGMLLSLIFFILSLSSNVHPKYVQELLGHASIAQTLDTYSHVLEGMDGGIGSVMDAAVG
jgi:integrase